MSNYTEYTPNNHFHNIAQFNILAGRFKNLDNMENFKQTVINQIGYIIEEARELQEAVAKGDLGEIVDAAVDVSVTNQGLMQILHVAGIPMDQATRLVDMNNLSKYHTSKEEAQKTVDHLALSGVPSFISQEVSGDDVYFAVKNSNTGKLMKPYNFKPVNLAEIIKPDLAEAFVNKESE